MPLPETEQHRVKKLLCAFIERRVPPHARDHVKLICKVVGKYFVRAITILIVSIYFICEIGKAIT